MHTALENFLRAEILGKEKHTFIHQLNYRGRFYKTKWHALIRQTETLSDLYRNQALARDPEIIHGLIEVFEHTLFLFYCHANPSDNFCIKNFDKLSSELITQYYVEMRTLSKKLIAPFG